MIIDLSIIILIFYMLFYLASKDAFIVHFNWLNDALSILSPILYFQMDTFYNLITIFHSIILHNFTQINISWVNSPLPTFCGSQSQIYYQSTFELTGFYLFQNNFNYKIESSFLIVPISPIEILLKCLSYKSSSNKPKHNYVLHFI